MQAWPPIALDIDDAIQSLDLYAWSTSRTFRINQDGREAFIPWRGLMKQSGGDYTDVKDRQKPPCARCRPCSRNWTSRMSMVEW